MKTRDQTISPGFETPRTTVGEKHRRLAVPVRVLPATKMSWRGSATDQENPDIIVHRARPVDVAPANVVQRIFNRLPHRLVDSMGHQSIQSSTLIDFVEMWNCGPFVKHSLSISAFDRWPISVVQHSFDQIARRQHWYWIPIQSQRKSSAMRTAAM